MLETFCLGLSDPLSKHPITWWHNTGRCSSSSILQESRKDVWRISHYTQHALTRTSQRCVEGLWPSTRILAVPIWTLQWDIRTSANKQQTDRATASEAFSTGQLSLFLFFPIWVWTRLHFNMSVSWSTDLWIDLVHHFSYTWWTVSFIYSVHSRHTVCWGLDINFTAVSATSSNHIPRICEFNIPKIVPLYEGNGLPVCIVTLSSDLNRWVLDQATISEETLHHNSHCRPVKVHYFAKVSFFIGDHTSNRDSQGIILLAVVSWYFPHTCRHVLSKPVEVWSPSMFEAHGVYSFVPIHVFVARCAYCVKVVESESLLLVVPLVE